jgi:hypothetical protein
VNTFVKSNHEIPPLTRQKLVQDRVAEASVGNDRDADIIGDGYTQPEQQGILGISSPPIGELPRRQSGAALAVRNEVPRSVRGKQRVGANDPLRGFGVVTTMIGDARLSALPHRAAQTAQHCGVPAGAPALAITGVAHDRSEAKITVTDVPDTPGMAARIFRTVADAEINIDMVLQNISRNSDKRTDITFTLPRADGPRAVAALTAVQPEIGFAEVLHDAEVGKVSLVGAGMRSHPGVTATFCEALSNAGINIETMNTSEIRISVLCRPDQLDTAVSALHAAFDLGADEQAVVHAGTGR